MVYAWDMKSVKPSFTTYRELTTLELPKGTVLEIELVYEMTGEVSTQIIFIIGGSTNPSHSPCPQLGHSWLDITDMLT